MLVSFLSTAMNGHSSALLHSHQLKYDDYHDDKKALRTRDSSCSTGHLLQSAARTQASVCWYCDTVDEFSLVSALMIHKY
eukprot:5283-Heterococcus_DN1.PRE.3